MENKSKIWFIVRIVLVVLFGWTGWQRFVRKQYLSGAVFLLTGGLLLVGWIIDAYTIIKSDETKFFNK